MGKKLEGKVAWVTGASSGLGRACALELARRGASVALTARRSERISALAGEIEAEGGRALALSADVTDAEALAAVVQELVAELGRLDVALANAGFGVSGPCADVPLSDWRRQFETNVFGLVATVQAAVPELRKTRGRLALVSSVSAMIPTPGAGPYTASKYAVRGIGQTLAMELARDGVSCTLINPGFVASEIAQVDNQGRYSEERRDPRPAALMWTAEQAARVMVDAIVARKREYTFTAHGRFGGFLGRHSPGLVHFVLSRAR